MAPKRALRIYQYGSNFDPNGSAPYSPNDWIPISFSESSPSKRSCSIRGPRVSNSSTSDASTGIPDEITPRDLNMTDMSAQFQDVCHFFKGKFFGVDLPSHWSIEEFTQLVLGVEEVHDPSFLTNVYSNLVECGFHSCGSLL